MQEHFMANQGEQSPKAPTEMSEAEIEKEMRAFGRRTALLLATAEIPQEEKQAWAELVPEMTLTQLRKLNIMLEQLVPGQDEIAMGKLQEGLKKLQSDYSKKAGDMAKNLDEELTALEEDIAAAQQQNN